MRVGMWGWICGGLIVALSASAAPESSTPASASLEIRWNRDLLDRLGIARRDAAQGRDANDPARETFTVDATRFDWRLLGRGALLPPAGELHFGNDAPRLRVNGLDIDLRQAHLRLVDTQGTRIDVLDRAGQRWLQLDQAMWIWEPTQQALRLRTADLRVSPELAAKLRRGKGTTWALGEVRARVPLSAAPAADARAMQAKDCGAPNWHGKPAPGGGTYRTDVMLMEMAAQFMRCQGCDGPGGANGTMVITPSTWLNNNRNRGTPLVTVAGDPLGTSAELYAADVPWYTKFMDPAPPYQNDQHPFLLWNLYRIDADGVFTQIARSGLKHAFATANLGVECDYCNGGHVLGRACGDPYSLGSNDSPYDLGLRSEVIPATGQWGRCGSLFDPNCDGVSQNPSVGDYDRRMVVREQAIDPTLRAGATFLIEAWYVVREDTNIYNTMGTRVLTPTWNASSGLWNIAQPNPMRLGAAIDRWLELAPGPVAAARVSELVTGEGHAKLGARVRALGGGLYRYEFALMNLDFSRPSTTGAEPHLRVLSNRGFGRIDLPLVADAQITQFAFDDGDENTANDWSLTLTTDTAVITAPHEAVSLDWGSMLRFGFTADRAPGQHEAVLYPADGGTPAEFRVTTWGVGSSAWFADDFE